MIRFLWKIWVITFVIIILSMGKGLYSLNEKRTYAFHKEEKEVNNVPIAVEGDLWTGAHYYANVYYLLTPKEIRDKFQQEGWKIVLTDKNLSDHYYTGDVEGWLSGLTDYAKKTIYIYGNFYDIRNALLHEMGHYYDHMLGGASYTEDFKEIYEKEKNQLKPYLEPDSYIKSNAQEYFAESFSDYILNNEYIKQNVVETYVFLRDL